MSAPSNYTQASFVSVAASFLRTNNPNFDLLPPAGDSLCSLQKAVEQKETNRQQLREQLDVVERETRAKLLEIDAFNTQLKVNGKSAQPFIQHKPPGNRSHLHIKKKIK